MFSRTHSCWVDAPAKINLTLEILGRRPDGYHDLRSLLMPLAVCDRVTLREADSVTLDVLSDDLDLAPLGPAAQNLAVRAAELLRRRYGLTSGVALQIFKRIPIGGGLGGGSADAAAVLVGLNTLWQLGLTQAELLELGAHLGSDVPALLHGGAVCMQGRGERVSPALDGPAKTGFWVVLANPGLTVSTAEVYRHCSGVLTARPDTYTIMRSAVQRGDVEAAAESLFNGLEAGVFARHPVIGRLATCLREAGARGVLLSGSGASVFALVDDRKHGERVRQALPGDCWSVVTQTMPDGVMAAHGPLEP